MKLLIVTYDNNKFEEDVEAFDTLNDLLQRIIKKHPKYNKCFLYNGKVLLSHVDPVCDMTLRDDMTLTLKVNRRGTM
jgi:hypothetical protein